MRSKFFWLAVLGFGALAAIISCVSSDTGRHAPIDILPQPTPDVYAYDYGNGYENSPANTVWDEYEAEAEAAPDPGRLSLQSDTTFVAGRYAGFLTWGFFYHSAAPAPVVVAESSVLDIFTDTVLEVADIINFAMMDKALNLLAAAVLAQAPEAAPYLNGIGPSWLTHVVMDHSGLRVLLTPDITLWSLDFMYVLLPYEALDDAFLLGIEIGIKEPPHRPMIALPFDDGPSQYTHMILDLLEAVGGRATFCVLGNRIHNHPDALVRAVALGSEVIGHSWDHTEFTRLGPNAITSQINQTSAAIEAVIGQAPPPIIRVPFGSVNRTVENVARELGYALLHWSEDPRDWYNRDADAIYYRIISRAIDGSIVLLHDIHTATAEAMIRVIPRLIAEGFQLVTASELIAHHYGEMLPGELYEGRRLPWGVTARDVSVRDGDVESYTEH